MSSRIIKILIFSSAITLIESCVSLGPAYDRISNRWYTDIYETYVNGGDMSVYHAYASIVLNPNGYFSYNFFKDGNYSITGRYELHQDSIFIFTEKCKNSYEVFRYSIEDENLRFEFLSSGCEENLSKRLIRPWSYRKKGYWPSGAL
jgi:hypothetical protein